MLESNKKLKFFSLKLKIYNYISVVFFKKAMLFFDKFWNKKNTKSRKNLLLNLVLFQSLVYNCKTTLKYEVDTKHSCHLLIIV